MNRYNVVRMSCDVTTYHFAVGFCFQVATENPDLDVTRSEAG
jgi:hypothetical protein